MGERRPCTPAYEEREILRAEKLLENSERTHRTRRSRDKSWMSFAFRPRIPAMRMSHGRPGTFLCSSARRSCRSCRRRCFAITRQSTCGNGARRCRRCMCVRARRAAYRWAVPVLPRPVLQAPEISDLLEHSGGTFEGHDNATCIEMMAQEYYAQVASLTVCGQDCGERVHAVPRKFVLSGDGGGVMNALISPRVSLGRRRLSQCLCDAGRQWDSVDEACVPCQPDFSSARRARGWCAPSQQPVLRCRHGGALVVPEQLVEQSAQSAARAVRVRAGKRNSTRAACRVPRPSARRPCRCACSSRCRA